MVMWRLSCSFCSWPPLLEMWLHVCTRGDIGLQIRKAQHQVWFQGQDLVDLRAGEGGHSRFFVARLPRAHGEAGNAHDAMLLAEQVQRLGGLLGQADDALWSLIVI